MLIFLKIWIIRFLIFKISNNIIINKTYIIILQKIIWDPNHLQTKMNKIKSYSKSIFLNKAIFLHNILDYNQIIHNKTLILIYSLINKKPKYPKYLKIIKTYNYLKFHRFYNPHIFNKYLNNLKSLKHKLYLKYLNEHLFLKFHNLNNKSQLIFQVNS
jgi:hypothetical protein